MKSFKISLLAFLLISVMILPNCGPNDPDGKDKVDTAKEQANLFVQNWTLVDNQAKLESDVIVGWNGLTLSVTGDKAGGTLTTNINSLSGDAVTTEVWPASDNWSFQVVDNKTIIGTVVRDSDEVEMSINVTANSLIVTFTVGDSGSRLAAVDGDWTFQFER